MIEIRINRLVIRNFSLDDWKDLQEIVIDKEASEYAIYNHQFPTSDDEVKSIIEWFSKSNNFYQ